MKCLKMTTWITVTYMLLIGSLQGFAGRGYNELTGIYQWDTGKFSSVREIGTDNANGFPAGSPQINGKRAQSVAQGFDTRHRSPSLKSDVIVTVQFGIPDIVEFTHSLQTFSNDHFAVTPLSLVGQTITIGIWPGSVKAGNQKRTNAIYLQDYVVQPQDIGFYSNFTVPCAASGYDYLTPTSHPPCINGQVLWANGSNIRPLFFNPQGSGNHTRRVPPFVDQGIGPDGTNPFSEYPINFTTIRLKKPVKVHKEFWVGVLINLPSTLIPEQPGDDFIYTPVGVSIANVNATTPNSNGISYIGLGLRNNIDFSAPNIHPIANGYSPITALVGASFIPKEDEFYAIRAIPAPNHKHRKSLKLPIQHCSENCCFKE